MVLKEDFFRYQAQTNPNPIGLVVKMAKGSYIVDSNDNHYLDFTAGVSVCNLGHSNPKIIQAIKAQLDSYMHIMVYGEFIQEPAVKLTKTLASKLSKKLEVTYLTNSGTEAIEGALKVAKRFTGRKELIAAKNSYHGSTHGSLSVLGLKSQKNNYKPLLPNIKFLTFNNLSDLSKISEKTAGVILETIQGGAGFIEPKNEYLKKVKNRCKEVGALFILDEIQPGLGRTGKLFGFQHYNAEPDILVIGKALGGGLPIGAFCSSNKIMKSLSFNPKLGHITTFGGNPIIASAALACIKELYNSKIMDSISYKEILFRKYLIHPKIVKINGKGLMLALIFKSKKIADDLVHQCLKRGLIIFWLLWEKKAVRITPPLTISKSEIKKGCDIIISTLNRL
tara:strand:+ start:3132 stop:4313 length:1182 start_codon:yes stop_codon:yes gene_type:complete